MYEILSTKDGYFWILKGPDGEKLCHSEAYTTKQGAYVGILVAKRIARSAPIYGVDLQAPIWSECIR